MACRPSEPSALEPTSRPSDARLLSPERKLAPRLDGARTRQQRHLRIDTRHEEDRFSLVRTLDAFAAIADPLGRGHIAAIDRPRRRRRGIGCGRSLLPCPSLRPSACLAFSAAGRRRRTDKPYRDRHGCDRHGYENPLYMVEDAGAADLIAGGRLQLGISRGSPEQVIDGWKYFGYRPAEGQTDGDMGRRHAEIFLDLLRGEGFAQPNPQPMFPNPPGLLRLEPHSEGLRERIWWGAGSNATTVWAAKLGMNLQSSTLKNDETGEPFHLQQANQIRAYRAAWKEAGHTRKPRVSVSRSIFALIDDRDRAYFGDGGESEDQVGFIDPRTRAIFGRSYAAEPDVLIEQLREDEAIAEADTLLLTVPNQLGVAYNVHAIEAILAHVAPPLGWR